MDQSQARKGFDNALRSIGETVIGREDEISMLLVALFANGHVILEGLPGTGKTLLASSLANLLGLSHQRIQFTPDLMPSDITGVDVFDANGGGDRGGFNFIKGPIFANVVLADEINRATPKTQSALLEAMQEAHVTVGTTTYELDAPFSVIATQNPIEMEGTYPLPEAQLDRFMFRITMGQQDEEHLVRVLQNTTQRSSGPSESVLSQDEVLAIQTLVPQMPVCEDLIRDVLALVRSTSPESPEAPDIVRKYVRFGAGVRACQHLIMAAKAHALFSGRAAVEKADIARYIHVVLGHRLVLNFAGFADAIASKSLLDTLERRFLTGA